MRARLNALSTIIHPSIVIITIHKSLSSDFPPKKAESTLKLKVAEAPKHRQQKNIPTNEAQ
jgi:hypothetical protein